MCLAVPAQIISLDGTLAVAEMSGVKKQIDVTLTPEVVPGDWVVVHVGYALQRIDPEKAQEILEAAGCTRNSDGFYERDGEEIGFVISVMSGEQDRIDIAQAAAQQLREAGINCTVEIPAQMDWGGQMACLIGWGSPFDADDHTYKVFGTDKGANYSSYSNEKVDEYLSLARQSDDPEVRKEYYGKFQEELAEDPEFQARVASGQVQTLVKNENAAEVKTTKEAKISVAVFLVAMVGIVLLGAVSALVPTLSDGSKLPLTTVIEIFMLVAAAVTVLITKLDSNKVLDQPVFKTGMFAVVLAFGLCWLVNTFIADQSSFITDNMSVLTNEHPWIYIIAVFIVGAITTSQSSSTMIMVPIGIALGLPANIIVAGWIACSSNYFIPASGQCVAAIAFDTAGTTKIGKYVLNHSYMLPGLVCTVVSVVSAILIGAVVF